METNEIKPILEALIFVSGDPLSIDRIQAVFPEVERPKLKAALDDLRAEYTALNRGLQLVEIAGGYQLTTRVEMAPWIKELERAKAAARLSRPGLETLAIIAYKQPVTRSEVEQIRGVDAAGVLKTLMERKLVKIVGRKEVPGRPMMYGTTREFLQYFGLSDLTGLPTLKEFSEVLEAEREGEEPLSQDTDQEERPAGAAEAEGEGIEVILSGQHPSPAEDPS